MTDELAGYVKRMNRREDRQRVSSPAVYDRRTVLRAALGAAGAAALAACGGANSPTTGTPAPPAATGAPTTGGAGAVRATTTKTTARAPAAVGPVEAAGKIPSPLPGVPAAFTKLPPLANSVKGVPGRGGQVSALYLAYSPPPPRNDNRYWQELEKRLGVPWEPIFAPNGTAYNEKLTAFIASGDLPDLVTIDVPNSPFRADLIRHGALTDLTPHLTGAALQEFPNLAAFPEKVWQNYAIEGKLYGVPRPQWFQSRALGFRQDWAEKLGVPQPKNAEELFQLLVAFSKNDPDGNGQADTYGLASAIDPFGLDVLGWMFRVPNGWRKNPDGSLTNAIETEEYRQAVAFARRLWEAGAYHPDAPTLQTSQAKDLFSSGKIGAVYDGVGGIIPGLRANARKVNPSANVIGLVPPGHDGGKAATWNRSGYFAGSSIPGKVGRDRERVKDLLRIVDWFAAPFGSQEWLFKNYGLEGVHHTIAPDAGPVRNDLGKLEIGDLSNLSNNELVFYYDEPGLAQYMQGLQAELLAIGIDDPTLTLYAPTATVKARELGQLGRDRIVDIVLGRQPLSALDEYIKDWKNRGGDQIRKEYEEDLRQQ